MGIGPKSVFVQCLYSVLGSDASEIISSIIGSTRLEVDEHEDRYVAINDWVIEHDVKKWVSLDDDSSIAKLGIGHYVLVNPKYGLTVADANLVINLLS
jgi:hypothetical protein